MKISTSTKRAVFAGGVLCLFCLSAANSQGQVVPANLPSRAPSTKDPLGFPVPVYSQGATKNVAKNSASRKELTEEIRLASLGLPQTTKPVVKKADTVVRPAAPVAKKADTVVQPAAPAAKNADTVVQVDKPVVQEKRVTQPKGVVDPEEFQLSPPTVDQLFRAESEASVRARIRKAAQERKIKNFEFPKDQPLPTLAKIDRPVGATLNATSVPGAICYHPLYFEQRLPERYGFFVPVVQPILCAGKFYVDTLALPCRMAFHRPWQWECSVNSMCR